MAYNQRTATVYTYETELGDYYSVNLKDESGNVVSTQVMQTIAEANQVKENWERGQYQYLTES
jgi:hypothetical protein